MKYQEYKTKKGGGGGMFKNIPPSLCCLVWLCISSGQAEVVGVRNYCCHDNHTIMSTQARLKTLMAALRGTIMTRCSTI